MTERIRRDTPLPKSGPRGRRFKSCLPDSEGRDSTRETDGTRPSSFPDGALRTTGAPKSATLGAGGAASAASGGTRRLLPAHDVPMPSAPNGTTGPSRNVGETDVVNTTAARLRATLDRIVEETLALTRGIAVHRFERDAGEVVFLMGADFYFDTLDPPQQAAQMKVKRKYETFSEIVRVLLRAAPDNDTSVRVGGSSSAFLSPVTGERTEQI
ncbi:hypothetical protein ACOQFB_05250 [Anaeromyxobacter sp. Red801]|uniref:hypothetical protein n=1 Tax=Anaeromyxobacter sp. Red801 TaxID=3411632 RepID=UPI003BA14734